MLLLLTTPGGPLPSPAESPVARGPPSPRWELLQAPVALGGPASIGAYTAPVPLSPGEPVQATLTLAPSDPQGLSAYALTAGAAPLSPGQVAARFGPDPSSAAALREYLERQGISVQAPPNGLVWLVSGGALAFEQAFGTPLVRYHDPADAAGRVAYAAVPRLPAGLPGLALASPSPAGNLRPLLAGHVADPVAPAPSTSPATPGLACPNGSLTPARVQRAYNITPVLQGGDTGQGESIGIVDAYDTAENAYRINHDLALFSACYHLPVRNATLAWPVAGPPGLNNSTSSGWGLEIALDTQWAHATAPNASVTLVLSPNNAYGLYYGVDWLVATRSVDVISLSWGEPESGTFNFGPCTYQCNASSDGTLATLGPVLQAAAAEGMDTFVASGDCGANGGTLGYAPWYPASDPHAIGVGGTVLNVTGPGDYASETAWDGTASFCINGGGSGGGFSTVYPRPGWQRGVGFSRYANTTRGVPDVALVSAVPLGMFYQSSPEYVEGTSDAAPQWAGLGALLGEARGSAAGGLPGFLGPTIYQVLRSSTYSLDFHPVPTGWNGYRATYGWDPLTGVGTPNFQNLMADLLRRPVAPQAGPGTFLLDVGPAAGMAPLPVSLRAGPLVSGASAVSYTFYYGDTGAPYGEANATTGRSNVSSFLYPAAALNDLTYPGAGAFTALASATDTAGNVSLSTPVEVNVGNAGPIEVDVSDTVGMAGSPTQLRAVASRGTGPYHFAFFFGDGTYTTSWSNDQGALDHVYAQNGSYLLSVVANDSSTPMRGGSSTLCLVVGPGPPTCPTLPRTLVDQVVLGTRTLVAGATTPVRVQATFNGAPVAGAAVTLSAPLGSLMAGGGTTGANGVFWTNFTAPAVNRSAAFGVFANVTASGYARGPGEVLLLVDPATGPSLTPWVRFGQSPVVGGSSDGVVIGGLEAFRATPAANASLAVGISGASSGALTGTLDPGGLFATTWTAPAVARPVGVVLTVTLSAPGFTSAPFRFPLQVLPAGPATGTVAALRLAPTSTPSMGAVRTSLYLNASSGGPLTGPTPSSLSVSSQPYGPEGAFSSSGPGVFGALFSTPITPYHVTVILLANVSSGTGWSNGSSAGLVEVTPGYGPLDLRFLPSPATFTPGQRGNLTVQARSLLFGIPLARVFMLVSPNLGNPSQSRGNSVFGWTDGDGNLTFRYTAPNASTRVFVTVQAVGFVYNFTQANFTLAVNVTLPANNTPPPLPAPTPGGAVGPPSTTTAVLLALAALLAAAVVVAVQDGWRRRRGPVPHGPGRVGTGATGDGPTAVEPPPEAPNAGAPTAPDRAPVLTP